MARSLSVAMQAALNGDSANLAVLYTFEFATIYGLWTGKGETQHNGITYRAGGSVIAPKLPKQSRDGSVSKMTLELSTASHKDVTDDVLQRLFDEQWHMSRVSVQVATVDAAFSTVLDALTIFRGRIESAQLYKGRQSKIVAKCASQSIDLMKAGGLYRNDASQKQFDQNDRSLEGIGTLNGAIQRESRWGQG